MQQKFHTCMIHDVQFYGSTTTGCTETNQPERATSGARLVLRLQELWQVRPSATSDNAKQILKNCSSTHKVTWFRFHGQQNVWSGDCRVRRLSDTEQSGDGIRLKLLSSGWRPRYLLKLALFKMVLRESKEEYTYIISNYQNTRRNIHTVIAFRHGRRKGVLQSNNQLNSWEKLPLKKKHFILDCMVLIITLGLFLLDHGCPNYVPWSIFNCPVANFETRRRYCLQRGSFWRINIRFPPYPTSTSAWKRQKFPLMRRHAKRMTSRFGSTYIRKQRFSLMTLNKSRLRNKNDRQPPLRYPSHFNH